MLIRKIGVCLAGAFLVLGGCSKNTSQSQNKDQGAATSTAASKAEEVKGGRVVLQNKGSDTLVIVAQAWAEAYKVIDPNVAVAVSGGGSGTGISALLNGTVDIANSSRALKDKELETAKSKGINPKAHIVGHDALAIFVHKDNPMQKFSVEQLADIYGEGGKYEKWKDLGVKVPGCDSDEIVRVSRQNNSGTYEYFKEAVLGEKEFKLGSRDMHGSKDVVDLVLKTPCAIGYSGLAYSTPEVGMPCVVKGDQCVVPTMDAALDGSYPISRPLFMYTPGEPSGAAKKYIDWIMSDEGQCVIAGKGYAPIRKVTCKQ
jgi:phosphate transport system substrate-binding protein